MSRKQGNITIISIIFYNLIYCQNIADFVRGVGKSAIIAQAWRRVGDSDENLTTSFVRCYQKATPQSLCANVIQDWYTQGILWEIATNSIEKYANNANA